MLAGSRHLVDPCGVFAMVLVRKTTYLRYTVAIHPAHCKPCAVRCVSPKRKSEGTSVMPASPAARDISPTKGPPSPVSSATLPSKPDKEVSCLFILPGIVAEEHWSAQICKNIRLCCGIFLVTELRAFAKGVYFAFVLFCAAPIHSGLAVWSWNLYSASASFLTALMTAPLSFHQLGT